jgi:H+/Cl- antiporter ClcA
MVDHSITRPIYDILKRQSLDNLYFLGFSVAIGILAAIGALFFRSLIEIFQNLFWASGSTFLEKLINSPWWLKILVPVAGATLAPITAILTIFELTYSYQSFFPLKEMQVIKIDVL